MGLKEGQEKMSKSDPDSAIFMEDTVEDVKRKIKKAYCPPEVVEKNPIVDYAKHLILGYFGKIVINIESVSDLLLLSVNGLHLTLALLYRYLLNTLNMLH